MHHNIFFFVSQKGKVITKQVVEALIQKAVETQDVQYVKQVLERECRVFRSTLPDQQIFSYMLVCSSSRV